MRLLASCLVCVAIVFGFGSPATSQEGLPIARYDFWDVHVRETPDGTICVVASNPQTQRPTNVVRSEILFTVTNGAAYIADEIHVEMGYPLNSPVSVNINDGPTFTLGWGWVGTEGAWFDNDVENEILIAAMKRGRSMVVSAVSTRGTNTTDTYSLYGITAALARAAEECQ